MYIKQKQRSSSYNEFMLEKLVKSLSNSDMSLKENSNGIFKMYINNEDVYDRVFSNFCIGK